jgi:hemin uptake protein HemP
MMKKDNSTLSESLESKPLASPLTRINTQQLFGDAREISIEHLGEHYALTITKQNKLLLTKAKLTT